MADKDYRKLLMDEQGKNITSLSDAAIVVMALHRQFKVANGLAKFGGNRDDHPIFAAATKILGRSIIDGRTATAEERKVVYQARARVIKYARQAFNGPHQGKLEAVGNAKTIERLDTIIELIQEFRTVEARVGSAAILQRELEEVMGYGAW